MNNRLSKLESHTRAAHTAAWHHFFQRLRVTLDGLPSGMFEGPFRAVDLDELADLEPELVLWEQWSEAVLPKLEQAEQGDLSTWPGDLPCPPADPSPLILEVVSRWRKHPSRSVAALLVLLALGAACWGEGGVQHPED